MKPTRSEALRTILSSSRPSSQDEIIVAMQAMGHTISQATLSREMKRLKAERRISSTGEYYYVLPEPGELVVRRRSRLLDTVVKAINVTPASGMVVVKTMPGQALALATAIDEAQLEGVVGTVAGYDTIIVAVDSQFDISQFAV